jgi:hypothetical protein
MVGYNNIDNGSELPDYIRRKVFQRDGEICWFCGTSYMLDISHQIDAVEEEAFARFQDNGTLPGMMSLSHEDNLFPLCRNCQARYDAGFPDWIIIPDVTTLKKYIRHEEENYDYRRNLISQATTVPTDSESLLRTLPIINRSKILYHPLIISSLLPSHTFNYNSCRWPKVWLGEPTTVIHRVARRGLLESTPVEPITLGKGRKWQRGVPAVFQLLVGTLVRLWARPTPVKGQLRNKNSL